MENAIAEITALLLQSHEVDISIYEEAFLKRTMNKRLFVTKCIDYSDYFKYLKTHKSEIDLFLNSLHNGFSEFFRNPLTFSIIEQIILPSVLEKKKNTNEKELRIWSAACAAGQETYSISIVFDEMMETCSSKLKCRIFATDHNQAELSNAMKGTYQTASINKVTFKRINKYFTQQGENFTIIPKIKEYIDFSVFDLLTKHGESPPASIYGNFDLIFCSNVLFYYKPEYRFRILEKLSKNLSPGGYLITGEAEREIVKSFNFREVFLNSAVFQKIRY